MTQYLLHDAWNIIEEGFQADHHLFCESCFTTGNGRMVQRGNFEEQYSGPSLQGNYLTGVNAGRQAADLQGTGYPSFFNEVVIAPNWIGIDVHVDGEALDLATCKVKSFRRVLNMREGTLDRSFTAKLVSGKELKIQVTRFCSLDNKEIGVVRYAVKPLNFDGVITVKPYLDGEVRGGGPAGDEHYWDGVDRLVKKRSGYLVTEFKQSGLRVSTGMKFHVFKNKQELELTTAQQLDEMYVSCAVSLKCKANDEVVVVKYVGVVSSFYHEKTKLLEHCQGVVRKAFKQGFDKLLKKHVDAWAERWAGADIGIEGDLAAQQGIRFCIFQLLQASTDAGGKAVAGTKDFCGSFIGGITSWRTEVFYLPFCLSMFGQKIARDLLLARYQQLSQAIENAGKLGFTNGAALYPLATVTGDECSHQWEYTLEEVHRNGAVVFAIYDYIRYTGDRDCLAGFGLEILVAIARFWAQRVHWSLPKKQYVIHGVTGPNGYEAHVNNNWYTNYIAVWSLKKAMEALMYVEDTAPEKLGELLERLHFDRHSEWGRWVSIVENMYLPKDENSGIFLQQEGFLDKELQSVDTLGPEDRPLELNWSRDRILRACFIRQADVLQGLYLFDDHFSDEEIRGNFDFYEPMTLHESSLSAPVHAVLAARAGHDEKAWALFVSAVRFDLDQYGASTGQGLHLMGMAGAWQAFVRAFGGMRVEADRLSFSPKLPEGWERFTFNIHWRGYSLLWKVEKGAVSVTNRSEKPLMLKIFDQVVEVAALSEWSLPVKTV